ncbi:MAG: hypothetical protein AAFR75_04425 [Pseudomonadota bacterium]
MNEGEPVADIDFSELIRRSVPSTRLSNGAGSGTDVTAPYLVIPLSWEQCGDKDALHPSKFNVEARKFKIVSDVLAGLVIGAGLGLIVPFGLFLASAALFEFPVTLEVVGRVMSQVWAIGQP